MITAFRANLCKRKEAVGHLYTRSAIQHWLSAKIVSVTFSYLEPASGHFLTVASKAAGSIWPALACRQAARPSQATQIAFHYPVPRSAHPNPSHPYIPDLKKIVFIAPQDPFVLKRFQGTGQLVSRLSGQMRLTGLFCAF